MKQVRSIIFLFSVLMVRPGLAQDTIKNKIDSLAVIYMQHHAGALVIGIKEKGHERIFRYGETEKGNRHLPDSNSIFEIGNISETFTCILYADLSVKGIIHMDDPLQKYLPVNVPSPVYQPLICRPSEGTYKPVPGSSKEDPFVQFHFTPYTCLPDSAYRPQPILLCYLATHTSGLPKKLTNLNKSQEIPYMNYSIGNLYDFLTGSQLTNQIGFDYKHSEPGIALLGHALALKMKMDFDSLLVQRISMSLNMKDTRIQLSLDQQKRFLNGLDERENSALHRGYDAMAPAGAMHSTISDMMKFLSLNISPVDSYMKNLLDYTHNPRIKISGQKTGESQVALGWMVNPLGIEEKQYVWQSGMTEGFASFIGFVETNRTGVVILSNRAESVSDLGKAVLKIMN